MNSVGLVARGNAEVRNGNHRNLSPTPSGVRALMRVSKFRFDWNYLVDEITTVAACLPKLTSN